MKACGKGIDPLSIFMIDSQQAYIIFFKRIFRGIRFISISGKLLFFKSSAVPFHSSIVVRSISKKLRLNLTLQAMLTS